MIDENYFRTIDLNGGLTLRIADCTNRYFGDYHRIKLVVSCDLPVTLEGLPEDWRQREAQARELVGDSFHFERSLERMGVASADVDAVSEELLAGFLTSTGHYLTQPSFVAKLVAEKLANSGTPKRRFTLVK